MNKSPKAKSSFLLLCLLALGLTSCSTREPQPDEEVDGAPSGYPDASHVPDAVPKAEPRSRYGNPESYEVFGKRYYTMQSSKGYVKKGIASWYGTKFHGRRTSSGEPYDMFKMTAAHKELPLPTYAQVTNLTNGRSVVLKINDRGPFHQNRIIDLSYAAASKLGVLKNGTAMVEVRTIDPGEAAPTAPTIDLKDLPEIFLQVGAFTSEENAIRFMNRINNTLNRSVRLEKIPREADKPLFRVQVGPLDSVQLADSITLQLQGIGVENPHIVIN